MRPLLIYGHHGESYEKRFRLTLVYDLLCDYEKYVKVINAIGGLNPEIRYDQKHRTGNKISVFSFFPNNTDMEEPGKPNSNALDKVVQEAIRQEFRVEKDVKFSSKNLDGVAIEVLNYFTKQPIEINKPLAGHVPSC